MSAHARNGPVTFAYRINGCKVREWNASKALSARMSYNNWSTCTLRLISGQMR